jgi:hypothetical protein
VTWEDLVSRIELRLPCKAELRAVVDVNEARIIATLHVQDIHTRDVITVNTSMVVPPTVDECVGGEEMAVSLLYRLLRNGLMHELDEGFWLDGKHLRNPHNPDGSFR